jgi:hypothetical protein
MKRKLVVDFSGNGLILEVHKSGPLECANTLTALTKQPGLAVERLTQFYHHNSPGLHNRGFMRLAPERAQGYAKRYE